jgi:hypothetical protein
VKTVDGIIVLGSIMVNKISILVIILIMVF